MDADLSRREKLFYGIDEARMSGLEVGALDKPLVLSPNRIHYVDFASTEHLRRLHANSATVTAANIVEVDYVLDEGNSLATLAKDDGPFDYVIASHVFEHIPNPIRWFSDLAAVLVDGGRVGLIVPDRRYIFDRLRANTVLAEWIEAYLTDAVRPSPRCTFDYLAQHSAVDPTLAWNDSLDDASLTKTHDLRTALEITTRAFNDGSYFDTHCWTFTPESWVSLLSQLNSLQLVEFQLDRIWTTARNEIDFFVSLVRVPRAECRVNGSPA